MAGRGRTPQGSARYCYRFAGSCCSSAMLGLVRPLAFYAWEESASAEDIRERIVPHARKRQTGTDRSVLGQGGAVVCLKPPQGRGQDAPARSEGPQPAT